MGRLLALFNTTVVANEFSFEKVTDPESGAHDLLISDFDRGNILHCMNKNSFLKENAREKMESRLRKNVILMGDIVEDSQMVGDPDHETVVRVGYLNDSKTDTEVLERYKDTFDVVVTGDGPLLPVNLLLMHASGRQDQVERMVRGAETLD
mmetsp:Transcript_12715/g.21420  ORF Transcript_12715/g.21420 Transcript_12715/m.21420 type:complete len:151 (+) Transcript_12715:817-1269(+)